MPEHVSFSQIALFAECPEAYRRRYIEGERDEDSLPAVAGSAVHAAVEAWEGGVAEAISEFGLTDLARMRLAMTPGADLLPHYGKRDFAWWMEEGIPNACENYLAAREEEGGRGVMWWSAPPSTCLELQVETTLAGVRLMAIVDQVLWDPQGPGYVVIRDLKTGKKKPWHLMQLQLYMLAFLRRFPEVDPDRVYGQALYLGEKSPQFENTVLTLSESHLERMVRDLRAAQIADHWPVTGWRNDACGVCQFRTSCAWGQVGQRNVLLPTSGGTSGDSAQRSAA